MLKKEERTLGWGHGLAGKVLACMLQALGSIPKTTKKKGKNSQKEENACHRVPGEGLVSRRVENSWAHSGARTSRWVEGLSRRCPQEATRVSTAQGRALSTLAARAEQSPAARGATALDRMPPSQTATASAQEDAEDQPHAQLGCTAAATPLPGTHQRGQCPAHATPRTRLTAARGQARRPPTDEQVSRGPPRDGAASAMRRSRVWTAARWVNPRQELEWKQPGPEARATGSQHTRTHGKEWICGARREGGFGVLRRWARLAVAHGSRITENMASHASGG